MRNSIIILILSILAVTGCSAKDNSKNSITASQIKNEADLLDFYKQYSSFTNPGEYEYLYESLPESLPELCRLIRVQFIHPIAELPRYKE